MHQKNGTTVSLLTSLNATAGIDTIVMAGNVSVKAVTFRGHEPVILYGDYGYIMIICKCKCKDLPCARPAADVATPNGDCQLVWSWVRVYVAMNGEVGLPRAWAYAGLRSPGGTSGSDTVVLIEFSRGTAHRLGIIFGVLGLLLFKSLPPAAPHGSRDWVLGEVFSSPGTSFLAFRILAKMA